MQWNPMKPTNIKKVFLSLILTILTSLTSYAQQTLWVGESYTFDVTSSVMGITANMSWSTNGGYLSLSGTGFYRNITVTQYFSGTATVTCEWDYKLTSSGSYTHTKRQVTISCRDNQVSISPTSLTMSPDETRYVSYRHQYDNQYTSSANAYFQSSDPSICTVSSSGEVIAKAPGTAYINVYSKISSVTPYCKVTVEKMKPTSISVPASIIMTAGEQRTLTANLIPSNAQATISWKSSNNDVATVNSSGTITAKKHGYVHVTASTDNGLSSKCEVTINKSKLTLTSNHGSGLIQNNTGIQLLASEPTANIYYSIDGKIPTSSSTLYDNPIILTSNCKIKALAIHPDFIDSDVLELDFSITPLSLVSTNPAQGTKDSSPHILPCFTFNENIFTGPKFEDIKVDIEGSNIEYETIIGKNQLYVIPDSKLGNSNIKITIPEYALTNSNKDSNIYISTDFNYSSPLYYDVLEFTSNSRLMDNGDWYIWGSEDNFPNNTYNIPNFQQTPMFALPCIKKVYDLYYITADDILMGWDRYAATYHDGSHIIGDGTPYSRENAVKISLNVECFKGDTYNRGILKKDASLWLWGQNGWGQVGNGTNSRVYEPIQVLSDVKDFSLGSTFSLALKHDGSVWAWGKGTQIGKSDRYIKTPIKILSEGVVEIITGDGHCIALKENGDVYCFGENDFGQIGNGSTSSHVSTYKVMEDVAHIYAEGYGSFALKNNGDLYHWGVVCHETSTQKSTPQLLAHNVKDVFLSFSNILILKENNSLWCAGSNCNGLFSNGASNSDVFSMDFIEIFTDIEKVWLDGKSCFVKKKDGNYWGLGRRIGIEGDNRGDSFIPALVYNDSKTDIHSISLPDEMIIEMGCKGVAVLDVEPSNANYKQINWYSSDNTIASINEIGVITVASIGETYIEANVIDYNNSFSTSCLVKVVGIGDGVNEITTDIHNDSLRIFNINGMLIYQGSSKQIPNLNNGIYIIKTNNKTIKFIKQ